MKGKRERRGKRDEKGKRKKKKTQKGGGRGKEEKQALVGAWLHLHTALCSGGNIHHSELIHSYAHAASVLVCYVVYSTQPSSVGSGLVSLRIDRPTHVAPGSCFPFFSRTISSRLQHTRQRFLCLEKYGLPVMRPSPLWTHCASCLLHVFFDRSCKMVRASKTKRDVSPNSNNRYKIK